MEKEILMPHGSTLHCGKNVDFAPNGEEKKPRALQELRRHRKSLQQTPGREAGESWAAYSPGKADLL